MTKNLLIILPILFYLNINAQKDCTQDHTGLVPIIDLGINSYRGSMGGLYPDGSNTRPTEYLNACLENVQNIVPLNTAGNPDESGTIVMLGIGASNPGAEFNKFMEQCNYFPLLNEKLTIVNGCYPSTGLQEMNYTAAEYWDLVLDYLESNGVTPEQVQVFWIEQENTENGDTAFPGAALQLVEDYLSLLQTIKILFPNTQICYLTARAYSGYATLGGSENGLLFPRDYLNGWALKWFIENVINHELGYSFEAPEADIPLVTWGSYHWTDGSTPRSDGLFLDCDVDVAPDGLHLSGAGENKMGDHMFNYFKTDTTARYWFYDKDYTDILNSTKKGDAVLNIYPNPVTDQSINLISYDFEAQEKLNISVFSAEGKLVLNVEDYYSENLVMHLPALESGIYILSIRSENAFSNGSFIISE